MWSQIREISGGGGVGGGITVSSPYQKISLDLRVDFYLKMKKSVLVLNKLLFKYC